MAARESEWTYVLTPSDVAEIETALSPVLSRGLDIAVIRRAGFSLPRLGAVLERLYRPFPVDRRGEVPKGKALFYEAPVFNKHDGKVSALYSRLHIGSAQRFAKARRLSHEDLEALDMLAALAADPALRLDMTFVPGDIQFLHNHTILHALWGCEDWPEPERKRRLPRLWLSPPDARPLPPVFAGAYGALPIGDCGGIICKDTIPHASSTPA